jgi:hypothetical protein
MKKLILVFTTTLLLTTLVSTPVQAASKPETTSTATPGASAEANALMLRLNEIKAMDVSKMSRVEKRELRKEVKSTKEALRDLGHGGLYISGGAIIIIILLIILL